MPKKSVRRRLTSAKKKPRAKKSQVSDDQSSSSAFPEALSCSENDAESSPLCATLADSQVFDDHSSSSVFPQALSCSESTAESSPLWATPADSQVSNEQTSSSVAFETVSCSGNAAETSPLGAMPADSEITSPGSPLSAEACDIELLEKACFRLQAFLHNCWVSQVRDGGIHVGLMSRKKLMAIQRQLIFTADGGVELSVHCVPLRGQDYIKDLPNRVVLTKTTMDSFVDRCVKIVESIRGLEVCTGVLDEEFKCVWKNIPQAEVDNNPYQECRFSETLRSVQCERLVPIRKWQCGQCRVLRKTVRKKYESVSQEEVHPNRPNVTLSEAQKLHKLEEQRKKIHTYATRLERMGEKVKKLIDAEAVKVSDDMHQDFMDILNGSDVSPAHTFFMQQQVQAASCKGPSGVRWHPSMIRFALALHVASPAAYKTARESGMIKLPSQRTLFDYSHYTAAKEGIHDAVLEDVSERVAKMPHSYQKYHALMCDEMHICQNLVYQKSSGEMIGYVKLHEAYADMAAMEAFLEKGDPNSIKRTLAKKMLCFLIKGTASNVKEVVASYSVDRLTAEFLYSTTWGVIMRCERAGIAIVAFVSDGYASNRAFMKKHTPAGKTTSGLIYSTVNKAAPERQLFFMSDVAHLMKTIRNCLHNSKKTGGKRCLEKGGQKMVWQTIIDLYKANDSETLRKSYKLNAQNVYIDSYSAMKVKYAAQIFSKTVAQDLEDMHWDGTSELVNLLRLVNDWFDCMNGAFSTQGQKTRNRLLDPYVSVEDKRFDLLKDFLQYLSDWKEEVYCTEAFQQLDVEPSMDDRLEDLSFRDEDANVGEHQDTPASKKLLSSQTLQGIEITTNSFIEVTKFLLREGTRYINPRVFSQDHLEQHFSKQRHRGGGSSNPNYGTFLQNNINIHLQGQLGVRQARGNTEDRSGGMIITDEPLPRRKRLRRTL